MKRKLYGACGIAALAFAACSEDNGSNAFNEQGPVADASSSSVVAPLSSLAESSGSVEQSSSSLFGLSSSAPVPESSSSEAELSSSSAALSSSSAELLSSSSTVLSSSSSSCRRMQWSGYDNDSTVVMEACGDSTWSQGAVADGRWRVMETDSTCPYCGVYNEYAGRVMIGNSSVVFNPDSVSGIIEVPASTIEYCGGVCGTAVLKKGTLTYNPFVSVGFTLARDGSGKPVPVDVSTWNGICISYTSAAAPSLELDLGDSLNAAFGYAQPAVSLPKSSTGTRRCLAWDQFKFPSWFKGEAEGWRENTGLVASRHLVGVRFKLQASEGNYIFHIAFLGSNDLGVERFY